jgi:uncharacterized protein YeaC (DUF1315 family)
MPVDYDDMIDSITPETYQTMLRAIETGRWPNGDRLTEAQREHCMAAVIAWGERHLTEKERVGYIDRGEKEEGEVCDTHTHDEPSAVRFVGNDTRH